MSPILQLQRRLRELGRIRLGEQRVSKNGKNYPAKLDTFRLTSQDGAVISAAAEVFGGDPRPWKDAPAGEQFEVVTLASCLNVIVPPTGMAFSQWNETWTGGGCKKRCDGKWDVVRDCACDCDPDKRECAPHTRLSVILSDLPGLGVWRLDTQGYYAAVELAGVVDVIEAYAARGQMLPARLMLEQREVKRPGEPSKKFAVPVLDVDVNLGGLMLGGGAGPAVQEQPSFTPVNQAALPPAPDVPVASQMAAVNGEPAPKKPRKNAAVPMKATGLVPRTAAQAAAEEPAPTTDEDPGRPFEPPVDDGFDVDPIRNAIETFGPRLRKTVGETWKANNWGSIAENTTARPITKSEADAAWLYVTDEQEAMKKRSQRIAIACTKAGLDDDGRHALIAYVTSGETESSKDVTEGEVHGILEAAQQVADGSLVLHLQDDGKPYFAPGPEAA